MNKNVLGFFLKPCLFLLCAMDAMGQQDKLMIAPVKTDVVYIVKTDVVYTVKNVSGPVTLNDKPLKVNDKVRESDKLKILVGKDGYYQLEGADKKLFLYNAQSATPILTMVPQGNQKTSQEAALLDKLDRIMGTLNLKTLDQPQLLLDRKQL